MRTMAAEAIGMLYGVRTNRYSTGYVKTYATPRPIGRASDVSVGLAHVSALVLSLHVVVAEDADEDVESGTLRTRVRDGFSGAKMFRCTKPSISPRSGTLGRLRCPPRAPKFGISSYLFLGLSPHGC